jgi:hypothetical protein
MIHVVVMKCLICLLLLIHIELLWKSRSQSFKNWGVRVGSFVYWHQSPALCWSAAWPVTNVLFTALKRTDPASNWANIYHILSTHTLLKCPWNCIRLQPAAVRNLITRPCLVSMTTSSAMLHCHHVEHTWPTGAPMILVELDSVAIWGVRQKTLN